jgi:hypothetical protein
VRLRDVLDKRELGLTLLTGEEHLDRPVRGVYTTDLVDPRRYLIGGEIVLTGLMWRRTPADSETFVAALARAGVAALGAGDAALGTVPADLVDACRRHRIPLFEVPVEVSFHAISEEVDPALWKHRAAGLATVLGRQRDLMAAVAAGGRLGELFPALARDLGVACWILSPTGRRVAGTGELPGPVAAQLARRFLTAELLPCSVTVDGSRFSLHAAPGRREQRIAEWFLAYEPRDEDVTPEAIEELATLVALARAQRDERRRVERRLATELCDAVAAGADPVQLRGRLRSCGLPPDATFLVVTTAVTGTPDVGGGRDIAGARELAATRELPGTADVVGAVAEELVAPLAPVAAITTAHAGETVAFVPVAASAVGGPVDRLRADVQALESGLRWARLAVGLSEPAVQVTGLASALEEARHALRFAAERARPAAVVSSADLASYLLLLAGVSVPARRSFRDRLLGPLNEYDRAHDADLVRTLDTFLSCAGSWNRCAALMHVHVNTLRYRIRRIEELTGRDLSRFDDRVDFFLALRVPSA